MQPQQLCLACSSTIPPNVKPASVYRHGCCSRLVCAACLASNPRLTTFCPICEDAKAAFRKGPRSDVTRKGEVVFDASSALEREVLDGEEEEVPPPPYSETRDGSESAFVVDDGSDDEEVKVKEKKPSLLSRPTSKSAPSAEVDIAPRSATTHDEPTAEIVSLRRKVDPHTSSTASTSSSSASAGSTRQYWLRKTDTLQSISIRFAVSTNELCLLNALPRAVLSSSPHLLHTRSFLLIPAQAVEKQLANNPQLASSLQGPPRNSARDKTSAARRTAEAKFRAALAKTVGETPADERAARAYVGLAEDEMRRVEFGEGVDEAGVALAYDEDPEGKEEEMVEAQQDTARRLRFDAILKHALAKWEMDSDWERCQRANGVDPSGVSRPLTASTSAAGSSANATGATQERKAPSNGKMTEWFARALHGEPRGESVRATPRHVVSLSSSVKLPSLVKQTFPSAHKAPINVARYSSTGRYLLTGSSDRTIRLWNASTAEQVKSYTEHRYEVLALDVSADNSRFVSGGVDKSVFVWDVATGSVVRRFNGWIGKINDVRFAGKDRDGSVVVVGGFDGVVRVYDLRAQGAWRPIMELKEATDAITTLSVSCDRIYSGSVDGVVRCYDLRSGQLRSDTFAAPITSIYPSKMGTSTLVATLDSTVRLVDGSDGTLLQEYKGHTHGQYRCKAVLTPDEDGVVVGDEDGRLVGWDMVSAEQVLGGEAVKAHGKQVLWIEFNPQDRGEMVSAGADGVVKLWSTPSM